MPVTGPKPSWYFGVPVIASAPRVRPWNELWNAMTLLRAGWPRPKKWWRASFNIASLASAPELQKNARSMPVRAQSAAAARTFCSFRNQFETWITLATCSVSAATSFGCACPTEQTATPAQRSSQRCPSASKSSHPDPRTKAIGAGR
jgi:hypothetical protein